MAKTRKFVAYRRLERPYTRRSKYKSKSYIKVNPVKKIVRFDMGNLKKKFAYTLSLISKKDLQIRDTAIESGRQTSNRAIEKIAGKSEYFLKIRVYPHHILRENPLAAGAGADRMSTGMSGAFGKAIGSAARVFKGQTICQLSVNKEHLPTARDALRKFSHKMPCSCAIEVEEN
ncbi:50S ribosomal protein L16 [Nanoarchaeota archaeon]